MLLSWIFFIILYSRYIHKNKKRILTELVTPGYKQFFPSRTQFEVDLCPQDRIKHCMLNAVNTIINNERSLQKRLNKLPFLLKSMFKSPRGGYYSCRKIWSSVCVNSMRSCLYFSNYTHTHAICKCIPLLVRFNPEHYVSYNKTLCLSFHKNAKKIAKNLNWCLREWWCGFEALITGLVTALI